MLFYTVITLLMLIQTSIIYWICRKYAQEEQALIDDLKKKLEELKQINQYLAPPPDMPEETVYGELPRSSRNLHLDKVNGITIEDLYPSPYDEDPDEAWTEIEKLKADASLGSSN